MRDIKETQQIFFVPSSIFFAFVFNGKKEIPKRPEALDYISP
jgi:hypothetical protein